MLVIVLFTLTRQPIQAQQATGTTGGDINGIGGSVAYSVGISDYSHFEGPGGKISLGVQQPLVVKMVGTNDPHTEATIYAYPNPANQSVNISMDQTYLDNANENPSLSLFNLDGKMLVQQNITSRITSIPLNEYASGMYLLRVISNQNEVKLFKIFKTN